LLLGVDLGVDLGLGIGLGLGFGLAWCSCSYPCLTFVSVLVR